MLVVFSFAGACSFLSPYLLYMFVSMTCLIIAVFLFDTSYLYFYFDYPLFPLTDPTPFSYVKCIYSWKRVCVGVEGSFGSHKTRVEGA